MPKRQLGQDLWRQAATCMPPIEREALRFGAIAVQTVHENVNRCSAMVVAHKISLVLELVCDVWADGA